jgi:hypothetical protein
MELWTGYCFPGYLPHQDWALPKKTLEVLLLQLVFGSAE